LRSEGSKWEKNRSQTTTSYLPRRTCFPKCENACWLQPERDSQETKIAPVAPPNRHTDIQTDGQTENCFGPAGPAAAKHVSPVGRQSWKSIPFSGQLSLPPFTPILTHPVANERKPMMHFVFSVTQNHDFGWGARSGTTYFVFLWGAATLPTLLIRVNSL